MSAITIFENEAATLIYHPEAKIVHHTFHRDVRGKAFRDVLNAGLEVFQEFGANKWLSDDRRAAQIPDIDMEWARTDWFPRVVAQGWKYWALVLPREVDSIKTMRATVHQWRAAGLMVMYFTDPKPALTWLASQN